MATHLRIPSNKTIDGRSQFVLRVNRSTFRKVANVARQNAIPMHKVVAYAFGAIRARKTT